MKVLSYGYIKHNDDGWYDDEYFVKKSKRFCVYANMANTFVFFQHKIADSLSIPVNLFLMGQTLRGFLDISSDFLIDSYVDLAILPYHVLIDKICEEKEIKEDKKNKSKEKILDFNKINGSLYIIRLYLTIS